MHIFAFFETKSVIFEYSLILIKIVTFIHTPLNPPEYKAF
jgi:hypothetical protein